MTNEVKIDVIRALKDRIKDNWSLCDFLGKAEKEYMVATTIHACVTNYDATGKIFSFKGDNLNTSTRLAQNRECYAGLVADGYLTEVVNDEQTVVVPTKKLITALLKFFKMEFE